jgi:hypothetical protein
MRRVITAVALLLGIAPHASAQDRHGVVLNLLAGPSSYDLAGTGTSLAVAGHVTWFWLPALAIEPGVTYFTYNAYSTLVFPELSVQAAIPRGPFRPYLGGGVGLTIPASGGGGTHRSLHAVVGVRVPLGNTAWLLRGEFRPRSPHQWGSVTADLMFGIGRRIP